MTDTRQTRPLLRWADATRRGRLKARPRLTMAAQGWMAAVTVVAGMALASMPGCGPSDQDINAFIHATEASVSSSEYRVQPPDTVEISSPNATELDGLSQVVRPDGKITVHLIGEVKVAGMTPMEIAKKLESLLQQYYVDPQVSVRVTGQGSKRFYVFGEVSRLGPYPYTGRDTLLQVLAEAQPTFVAWKSQIKVIRPSPETEKRRVMTIDADRIMQEGLLEQNILLQEGDIIYVPPTPLAWLALRLREVMWPFRSSADEVRGPEYVGASMESTADWYAGGK